ncbi:MAG: YgiT-type zinc finger domain-containing protein [Desulforhopalus sp.]|jgi:YgiT-type zinc finger domain-containing protein
MRCYNCGDTLLSKSGTLQIPSDILNDYLIENVSYFSCPSCNEIILTNEAWEKADRREAKLIAKSIGNLPISAFVGASKAASILGMSRQALHKHRRIRRGLVYSIAHEGKIFYHLESISLFKETGDGRFNLSKKLSAPETEYVLITLPILPEHNYLTKQEDQERLNTWKKTSQTAKGSQYAI